MKLLLLLVAFVLCANGEDCPQCELGNCEPPSDCLAGLTKDNCDCCFICAQREGERCYNSSIAQLPASHRRFGTCGDQLECRLRTDMEPTDPPEAVCYCVKEEAICGSDGRTYENECQLTEARYKTQDGLIAVSRGPCKSAPTIVSPPEEVRNHTGAYIAFSCEVTGWPVPVIEWKVERSTGEQVTILPSDDPHIAVQSRGGPSNYEITGWLQIIDITERDGGIYYCVARNEKGEVQSGARLTIIPGATDSSYEDENEIR